MSSSSKIYRLLVVNIKSADIKTKRKGPFFVTLSFNPEEMFKTRTVFISNDFRVMWNQGFVFAVPQSALSDGKSSLQFEIFRKNSFLKDSLLGKTEVKLDGFEVEKKLKYDSSSDESGREDEEERERGERERGELSEMQKTVSVEMKKGKLEVEMVVSKGILSKVGKNCHWKGFAMELDEFMGKKGSSKDDDEKKTNFFLMCVKH